MNAIFKQLRRPQVILIIAALLIYSVIILFFGWPFVDESLIQGRSHAYASKDTTITAVLFLIQKYTRTLVIICLIFFLLLLESIEYQIRHLTCEVGAKRVRLTTKIMLGALILVYFNLLAIPALNVTKMILASEPVLREYSRAAFVRETGWGLFVLVGTYSMFTYGKNILSKRPTALIAGYYLQQHNKLISEKDIGAAKIAIEKACDIDPLGIAPWIVRAMFDIWHLDDYEEAKSHFETAMHNLILANDVTDEERASYEYCRGIMHLGNGDIEEAKKAIELSLKLNYNSDRVKFLDKLRQKQNHIQ